MPRKIVSKARKSDMDMRAPVPAEAEVFEETTYEPTQEETTLRPATRRRKGPGLFFIIVTLIVLGAAMYFYYEWRTLTQDPQSVNQEKTQEIVQKVSRLIDLPADETPVLATITDVRSLADQPFFANAKEGHIVLYYTVARKAYLYDPEDDILVEVATLGEGSQI